jgi:hypothetical protein
MKRFEEGYWGKKMLKRVQAVTGVTRLCCSKFQCNQLASEILLPVEK